MGKIIMEEIEKIKPITVRLANLHAKGDAGTDNAAIKNNDKIKKNKEKESIFINKDKNNDENLQISIPKTIKETENTMQTAAK